MPQLGSRSFYPPATLINLLSLTQTRALNPEQIAVPEFLRSASLPTTHMLELA